VKLPRRQFLHLAVGAVAFPAVLRTACAQTYPSRPVRVIIGFAPGGGVDIVARLIGQWLSQRLRQPFIIENRPGAGSTIAAEAVVAAPPDGYTLFWATSANAINATLYDNLSYNFVRDIAPVAGIIRLPNVMEVNLVSGQDRSRIHCLREGQSRQDQRGNGLWNDTVHGRRAVHDDDRRQRATDPLPRRSRGGDRSSRR
jgi:hypothetical protein